MTSETEEQYWHNLGRCRNLRWDEDETRVEFELVLDFARVSIVLPPGRRNDSDALGFLIGHFNIRVRWRPEEKWLEFMDATGECVTLHGVRDVRIKETWPNG